MSDDIDRQLREDRALRNAARAILDADMAHLRASLVGKSIGSRIVDRIGRGAADVFDEAVEVADSHKGALATLLAAVVLWFARNPLIALFSDDAGEDDSEAERERDADR